MDPLILAAAATITAGAGLYFWLAWRCALAALCVLCRRNPPIAGTDLCERCLADRLP